MRRAPCLMVQGTASGVGKSLLVTALCRLFARAGHRVAPFKSQNMSLNAAVTVDGGEIGRAQAAQAEAAGREPTVDMNPILLKPEGDDRSQVIVRGRAVGTLTFREYQARTAGLLATVAASLARLRAAHDLVVIEGAGSPVEINLPDEIVNMRIARLAAAPVLLVGDLSRGGVFAALVGTLALLAEEDRARVAGFVINRLRGDARLLQPGLHELAARTGVPVLGVVPDIGDAQVAAEDSLDLDAPPAAPAGDTVVDVAVVRLPRVANFDDFEPLAREPGVRVRFVTRPADLDGADLVVLPGSKSTIADLEWLRRTGFAAAVTDAARAGRPVLGVCGGYQMLGRALHDPDGVESATRSAAGLGVLPVATTFARDKTTVRVRATVTATDGPLGAARGAIVNGYEIHAGVTQARAPVTTPFAVIERAGRPADVPEGAMQGNVLGTYLHGLFTSGPVRRAVLCWLAARGGRAPHAAWGDPAAAAGRYDRLADIVGAALDMKAVGALVGRHADRA